MNLMILLHAVGSDPFEIAALILPGSILFAAGFGIVLLPVLRADEDASRRSAPDDRDRSE